MKNSEVVVPWQNGLHLRTAATLVRAAQNYRSTILLKHRGKIADLRSILNILALCATMGTTLIIEASGDDEQDAIQAIEQAFAPVHAERDLRGSSGQTA